jgi:uncharacterized membrane protein YdbT with pleckstrin-like domain
MGVAGHGYDWLTLDSDEEILWTGEPATESLYGAYIVGVPMILALGVGLLIIAGAHLARSNTDYVLTTKSVYKKTGVMSRSVAEIEHKKIQNTSFAIDAVGRFLGYGNVEISTAGGSGVEMRLRAVTDPQDVQQRLSKRVTEVQGSATGSDGPSKEEVLEAILTELRTIREAVEQNNATASDTHTSSQQTDTQEDSRTTNNQESSEWWDSTPDPSDRNRR